MAKDPAFLFYPNDWVGGTMGMTFEEKGAYMEVLMMQFNRGHMTSHMVGQVVGQIWDKIKHKFIQDSENKWYNERLDLEKENRKIFTNSRRNNLSGKNQYSKNEKNDEKSVGHMGGHVTSHMEDENENNNITLNTINNKGENFSEKDFNGISEKYINSVIKIFYTTKRINISKVDVENLWDIFKSQKLDGENFYKNKQAVYNHFVNWAEKKNITKSTIANSQIEKLKGISFLENNYVKFFDGSIQELGKSQKARLKHQDISPEEIIKGQIH